MRPINNIVDVTNYVMLEWGQPLHAFDYDSLKKRAGGKAPTITVRLAQPGEMLKTLDGNDRKLTPEMLVIADEAGPIALAGVMGGAETEVSAATTNILLESANFDFLNIRRTMKALNLPSEASVRFSKGIHPELVRPAAERAAELMRQHAGATVCKGIVDVYPAPLPPRVIELKMSEVRRLLGIDLPIEECARLLKTLEFQVAVVGIDVLHATVPPHRLDIQEGAADLIEDLVRLHGYDRLPATLLADQLPPQATTPPIAFEERVRDLLVDVGLQEVITYSLTTPEREALLGLPVGEYVTLLNPISDERRGDAAECAVERLGCRQGESEIHQRRAAVRDWLGLSGTARPEAAGRTAPLGDCADRPAVQRVLGRRGPDTERAAGLLRPQGHRGDTGRSAASA